MAIGELQKRCAGTRLRFGIALMVVFVVSVILPMAWFVLLLSAPPEIHISRPIFYLMLLIVAVLVMGLYALRLRQIGRSTAWSLLALVPVANIALPIFLLIENSPEERAGKTAFIVAAVCIAGFVGLVAYNFSNPPGFSRADPTGCYLVEDKPVFQLRNGQLLQPSGAGTGVTYRIESSDVGNSVVTDHEIGLVKSGTGVKLAVGIAQRRWNSSVDTAEGPAMMMSIGDDLRPIMAVRQDKCL